MRKIKSPMDAVDTVLTTYGNRVETEKLFTESDILKEEVDKLKELIECEPVAMDADARMAIIQRLCQINERLNEIKVQVAVLVSSLEVNEVEVVKPQRDN